MRSALVRTSARRGPRGVLLSAAAALTAGGLLLTGCAAQADETSDEPSASQEESAPEESDDGSGGESEEPAEEILMAFGDDTDQVRELQARLAQLGHFTAQPTGYYGDVTVGAVSEYQRAADLEVSGEVGESTWAALTEATTDPTEDELFPPQQVMGYGDNSDQVRELQARLAQLGHFEENPTGYYGDVTATAVSAFQTAAGLEASGTVFDDTWAALTGSTTQPTEEEMYPPLEVPDAEPESDLDERCLEGRVLCVSKTSNTLSWVVDGDVQLTLDVRFGAEETPTREGEFEVYWKSRNHHSTLYDSPMPYAMFFDGGQAVHYSEDFAANGYNGASHGCVNVRDEDAIAGLFDEVNEGDKVVVYW
ncbi:Peptidoglycan-binding (PGRP) domain of peptidoglycan hydrolases-containing protein [Streptomyces zhaozhouensis]|uniref:Peptidoglycan-binding (PGRP) domain of peptidoglycan hydrolases-containing protein n=1 Tax=Streptomyces zhaozhouensis TaxID=1300267 RepID=A0A286DZ22_9ACTN|nr:Peptidoglycan-binding (PGRP) domain of peptidoglycan hydrolases-containing protein [Streptomyces zhaozhouensis]